jgi:hypothetical protein
MQHAPVTSFVEIMKNVLIAMLFDEIALRLTAEVVLEGACSPVTTVLRSTVAESM